MKNVKRTAAIIGCILMVAIILVALISAIFATEYSHGLFLAAIFSMVVIPIMIFGYIEIYKYVHRNDKKNDDEENDK